ncbi:MAG TPA: aminodeoxychorismate/anthranilate synthase component II [Gemmatimonadales bacterium]|nr:aminodeoxychorismate/anthranilate synthase component II [Gemmatimonadales bacterium]
MSGPRVLLLDNRDSFVWNLARYVRELGAYARVVRSDAVTVAEVAASGADRIIVSPGPCTPAEAGVSVEVIRALGARLPILGVCLGHQAIGAAYGARVVRAARPVHGKTSAITHDGTGVLAGLPSPFRATRYHSLVVERATLPETLVVQGVSEEGAIMALRHRDLPVHGVQFHPESVLTEHGHRLLRNFLAIPSST